MIVTMTFENIGLDRAGRNLKPQARNQHNNDKKGIRKQSQTRMQHAQAETMLKQQNHIIKQVGCHKLFALLIRLVDSNWGFF